MALSNYDESTNSTGDARTIGDRGGMIVYVPYGGLYGDCRRVSWLDGGRPHLLCLSCGSGSNNNINNNVTSNSNVNSTGIVTRGSEETRQQPPPLLSFQVPTIREGGIWAPSGAAIDQKGSILVATGNGQASDNFDYGNSVIKLSSDLGKVIDWFAPSNWAELDSSDTDLGSVGPSVLSNNNNIISEDGKNHDNTTDTSEVFQIGKEGIGYLLNGDKLGGIDGQIFSANVCDKGAYGGTAYAAPYLYVPCSEGLVALYLQSADDSNNTTASGSNAYSSFMVKWTGPSLRQGPPIVADGLVWAIDINKGQLYAFDQSTGEVKFQEDLGGNVVHFSTPSSSQGQIFVAASNEVLSFSIK